MALAHISARAMGMKREATDFAAPAAELMIAEPLVAALLAEQQPDLADLPISPLAAGWDNAMFRLGSTMIVRMPRRRAAARLLAHEQVWLPQIARGLPLTVPVPLRRGGSRLLDPRRSSRAECSRRGRRHSRGDRLGETWALATRQIDLAGIWMLFENEKLQHRALRYYGASAAEVARAKAWAVSFGALLLETGLVGGRAPDKSELRLGHRVDIVERVHEVCIHGIVHRRSKRAMFISARWRVMHARFKPAARWPEWKPLS
jgi:hypothetical protein